MEEVVAKVMQVDKVAKLFQTTCIIGLNVGNLNLEAKNLKNILAIKEQDKAILQVELDKKMNFQREYKHNIEIWKEIKMKNEQKIKTFIKKIQGENHELKTNLVPMKSQDEKLREFKKMAKDQETTKRKWAEILFHQNNNRRLWEVMWKH